MENVDLDPIPLDGNRVLLELRIVAGELRVILNGDDPFAEDTEA